MSRQTELKVAKNKFLKTLLIAVIVVDMVLFFNIVRNSLPEAVYREEVTKESLASLVGDGNLVPETNPYDGASFFTANLADSKIGNLVLVNKEHEFDFEAKGRLVSLEKPVDVYLNKNYSYLIKDRSIFLGKSVIEALNLMLGEFETLYGNKGIMILSAYRNYAEQQSVYERKMSALGSPDKDAGILPAGKSDFHTGLSAELVLFDGNRVSDYNAEGDFEWISANCHKYGFVIRYPEGKEASTGVKYTPGILRYVGVPHSAYMYENSLCLEEYIQLLEKYSYASPLIYTYEGVEYTIYSCGIDRDGAEVAVPDRDDVQSDFSGTNRGSIIVTLHR